MAKSIRLDPEARTELREATHWYEQQRPGLGVEFVEAVDVALVRAAVLGPECRPALGVAPALRVKRVLVKRFPYVVYFVELATKVRILAIGHERRKPGYWRRRL